MAAAGSWLLARRRAASVICNAYVGVPGERFNAACTRALVADMAARLALPESPDAPSEQNVHAERFFFGMLS